MRLNVLGHRETQHIGDLNIIQGAPEKKGWISKTYILYIIKFTVLGFSIHNLYTLFICSRHMVRWSGLVNNVVSS